MLTIQYKPARAVVSRIFIIYCCHIC